ncbi:MAG: DUF2235 domain-containing protein [Pseudomonadota bacterium]
MVARAAAVTGQAGRHARRRLVVVCEGTLSSNRPGERTNAGRLATLLDEIGQRADQRHLYHPGIQGGGLTRWINAATGRTIDRGILAGYAFLAEHYRPGDAILLFGYSRGAYAMRSLAGMIGRVGLVRADAASPTRIGEALDHYRACLDPRDAGPAGSPAGSPDAAAFAKAHCHRGVAVEMLGVWDTVRALGLPVPGLDWLMPEETRFHDDALGPHIRHGYHAMALDEDRAVFAPVPWRRSPGWRGRLVQCWFSGGHGDVGGQVRHYPAARGLANIPLNWMLRLAAGHGLRLPRDWATRFPEDPAAPSSSGRSMLAPFFVHRTSRRVGTADGETLHPSVAARAAALAAPGPPAAAPTGAANPA